VLGDLEQKGKLHLADVTFDDDGHVRRIIAVTIRASGSLLLILASAAKAGTV
jgi:hypothetical protein